MPRSSIFLIPLLVGALLCSPARAQEDASSRLARVLALPLESGAPNRLERISDQVVFGKFASAGAAGEMLPSVDPEELEASWSGPAMSVTDTAIEWALSRSELPGPAAGFRARLTDLGMLPAGGRRQVLITLVETERPAELFDFSPSERFSATQREADLLDQGRSTDPLLDTQLRRSVGGEHPRTATFDSWKFDDLPEVVEQAEDQDARRAQLAAAQRARFLSEAVRALFWLDPSYEPTVIAWVEGMTQDERNRLVQLLQIAGFTQLTPQLLVRESAPHLHQTSVLTARLYQRLERLTTGTETKRRLDPDQFADSQTLERAQAFYRQFFVSDRKGRFEFELTEEVEDFVQAQSALVRELTQPHLEALLGGGF